MSTTTNKQGKKTKIAPTLSLSCSLLPFTFKILDPHGGQWPPRLASPRLAAGPFRWRRVVRSLAAGLWTVSVVVVMWPYITFIIQCVIESLPG